MLITMKEMLDRANQENYAVAAPNVCCEVDARAVLAAAEQAHSPVILDIGPLQCPDFILTGKYMRELAEQTPVPVAINLDHGGAAQGMKDNSRVITDMVHALQGGFTSVMIDRSSLPYEENVACVKELTIIAHSVGVSVESELGHVGDGKHFTDFSGSVFTDPKLAADYTRRTQVDCLAVSVGNAHGSYFCDVPRIDFDCLAAIKQEVGLPLVLHGGSGTGEENLYKACRMGVNKVNLYTGLISHVNDALKAADLSAGKTYDFWPVWQNTVIQYMLKQFDIFGSTQKAWTVEKQFIPEENYLFSSFAKN